MEIQFIEPAITACSEVLSASHLKRDDVKVLYRSRNLLLHFQPLSVVAKVAKSSDQPDLDKNLELKVAGHLRAAGVACVSPSSSIVPVQVYARDGFQITFWEYFEESKQTAFPDAHIPGLIQSLHAGLSTFAYEALPRFDARLDVHLDNLARGSEEMPGLSDSERHFLFNVLGELKDQLSRDPDVVTGIIHGDCRPDNLLRNGAGIVKWIDFETTCVGPIAWDYASFLKHGDKALEHHARSMQILSDIAQVCAAIRHWQKKDRKPALQQAAEIHLQKLKSKFVCI